MTGEKTKAHALVVAWQFFLILWKNFLLQVRRPIGTVFELIIPPFAVVVLIGLRFGIFEPEDRCFSTFPSDSLTVPVPENLYHIYYTPVDNNTVRIASCISEAIPFSNVSGVDSVAELEGLLTEENVEVPARTNFGDAGCFIRGAGIVFNDLDGSDNELEYTIRLRHEVGEDDSWETRDAGQTFQLPGPRITENFYFSEGFVHLESIVGEAIIRLMANENMTDCDGALPDISVAMRQLPYPKHTVDIFLSIIVTILPLFVILAYIYSAGVFTKELVLEKETRIRESMYMMGLQQWVLWTTWFIKQFLFLLVSSLLVTILLKFGQVFPETNFFLLLLFFMLFATASISWSFFISVWFSSARLGMVVSFVAWFFIYIPFFYVPQNYHVFPQSAKIVMCLLTNTCMGIGVTLVSEWEVRQQGLTLDTLLQPLTIEDDFHVGWVMVMLFVDTILFLVVAWYVNGVKPGRYGIPRPFYFPLQPSYWTGRPLIRTTKSDVKLNGADVRNEYLHEEEPSELNIGISIQNLVKIYDDSKFYKFFANAADGETRRKVAVDGLSLNMYEGQITALLGHNGAGKTTTISILTGLYTPTAGTAVINGYDIRSNMDQIRHSLGICPQHNILFDRLTVREHLKFFAKLKGVPGQRMQKELDAMIDDLQLQEMTNTPSRNLSGGMKRKLSVGIALIGGSRIVVLDEPTSGMDPYARRATWDLLAKHKEGRTILLTTHFMDEADLLGDRIAIMAEGKLRCSGSSLFLKSRYGVGYHMVIVKESHCANKKVCDLVLGKVPGSRVVTDVGAELSFILPSAATEYFPPLFDTLEAEQGTLGVSSYGISVTTMEEVFMKVREGADETLSHRLQHPTTTGALSATPPPEPLSPTSPPSHLSPQVVESPLQAHITPEHAPTEEPTIVRQRKSSEDVSIKPDDSDSAEVEAVEESERFSNERYPKMYRMSWNPSVEVSVEQREGVASEGGDVLGDDAGGSVSGDSDVGDGERSDRMSSSERCGNVLEVDDMGGSGDEECVEADVKIKHQVGNVDVLSPDEEVSLSLPLSLRSTLSYNKGLTLWLQKYWAMLVKRMYTSVRFWQAMVTQLILPLMFVLYAMVLAKTILFADNASDPKRRLSLRNSGLSSNRTFFWAEFDGAGVDNYLTTNTSSFFDFTNESLTGSLGATDFYDYSDRVLDLLTTAVHSDRDISQCCGYRYQMLDKYCASRSVEELGAVCNSFDSFPYHYCPHCLSCCTSRVTRLPSCTHPLTQNTNYKENQFCPSSPQTSLQDLLSNSTVGPLDTYTAYVDEVLMRLSHEVTAPVFTRRVMGGFVVQHRRDPPYTACGCGSSTTESICQSSFEPLLDCGAGNSDHPVFVALLPNIIQNQSNFCPNLLSTHNNSTSGVGSSSGNAAGKCDSLQFQSGYVVDGLGADLLSADVCECAAGDGGSGEECGKCERGSDVSAHYYKEAEEVLSVTVWYNNRPWHMSAASLNAFHNVWLRQATGNPDLTLNVNNHPLPRTSLNNLADVEQSNLDGYYVGTTVVFGYSFLVASFVLVLVAEKESKAKHLQFVSGGDVTSFWLAHLTWDMLNSLLPLILSVVIIAAVQVEPYSGSSLLPIACLLIVTCWSSIPIVYTASFLFTNSLIAFGVILVIFFLSCLIFLLVTLVVPDEMIKDSLHYIFLLNPSYALGIGLNDVYINHFLRSICTFTPLAEQSCAMNDIRYVDNLFSVKRPGIGVLLIYMVVEGLVFFILTLIIERHFFTKELSKPLRGSCDRRLRKHNLEVVNPLAIEIEMNTINQDSDVENEAERVRIGQVDSSSAIIINNLVKVYPSSLDGFKLRPAKEAVRGISLAIPAGECFGLLGVNGAGKTTTFNILIGDASPTSGTAIISGYDIRTDLRKVRQVIGYCPQFDALIERMTGRELLTMFARLRGIPERHINQAVQTEVSRLDLAKHARKQCGKYSGGNKRKLSAAIALIGDPPIILLDEPTTGMDPGTRRYLWDVLTGVTREGRSIVLTTHSMEECEALCTRLAIMVNGQFKCLGSIQHLKSKYGSGYTLQAKVERVQSLDDNVTVLAETQSVGTHSTRRSRQKRKNTRASIKKPPHTDHFNTSKLHSFINESFPGSLLLEEHQGAVTYQLCNESLRWATVFREMEHHRQKLGVSDYSVSQTTLEQVFVNFAKEQEEVESAIL